MTDNAKNLCTFCYENYTHEILSHGNISVTCMIRDRFLRKLFNTNLFHERFLTRSSVTVCSWTTYYSACVTSPQHTGVSIGAAATSTSSSTYSSPLLPSCLHSPAISHVPEPPCTLPPLDFDFDPECDCLVSIVPV